MPRSDFSALVKNPKMKLVLQDCGHLDSASLGKGYTLQVGIYRHKCTSGPSTWYRRAGISLQWWKSPRSATVDEMKRNLQSSGMVQVWSGTGQEANSKLNSSKYLRPGDTSVSPRRPFRSHCAVPRKPHAAFCTTKETAKRSRLYPSDHRCGLLQTKFSSASYLFLLFCC